MMSFELDSATKRSAIGPGELLPGERGVVRATPWVVVENC